MVLITGTNDQLIAALRRDLLHIGLISEKTTLSALCTRLRESPHVFAVLHIVEKHRPSLVPVTELARVQYGKVVHGVLTVANCPSDAVCSDDFDFVLPLTSRAKILCEQLVLAAISRAGFDPSDTIVGPLRYRLFQKEFLIVLKHFAFSDSYTALLCALMEAYPQGLSRDELMRIAFQSLGRRSRSNVSHAVDAINRRFFEAGLAGNGMPLICFDYEKGYFLRS